MIADGIAHLCAGGESACLQRHASALSRYLRDKNRGMAGREAQEAEIARARAGIARSWGVDAAAIGFVGGSHAGGELAGQLIKAGARTIVADLRHLKSAVVALRGW